MIHDFAFEMKMLFADLSRRFIAFSFVFGMIVMLSGSVFAQSSAEKPNTTESGKIGVTDATAPTYIIIDNDKQLGELLKRLETPDFQILRPTSAVTRPNYVEPIQAFIKSVAISGLMKGTYLQTTLQIQINQTVEGDAWTKVGLNDILLQSVTEDSKPVMASTRPDRAWYLKTSGKGDHNIEIQVAVEIIIDRSSRRVALTIPESPITRLSFEIPETVLFASTNSKEVLNLAFDKSKQTYQISGDLSPRNRVDIRWFGQSLLRNQPNQTIECRGMISMHLDLDAIITRQQWLINRNSDLPDKIEFNISSKIGITDLQLNGQTVKPAFDRSNNEVTKVSVPLVIQDVNAITEPVTVDLVTRRFYDSSPDDKSRDFKWSTPDWLNMRVISGVVAVELPEDWHVESPSQSNLQTIDPRDLPDRLRKTTEVRAFEFHGPVVNNEIKIRKNQYPLVVESATVGLISQSNIEYVSEMNITGDISTNRQYTITLPESAQLLFIGPHGTVDRYSRVENQPEGSPQLYRFYLSENFKKPDKFQIRVRYLDKIGADGKGTLTIPRLEGSLNHQATSALISNNKGAKLKLVNETNNTNTIQPAEIDIFRDLLSNSFEVKQDVLSRFSSSRNDIPFYRTNNLGTSSIPFQISHSTTSVQYQTDIIIAPHANSHDLNYKILIDPADTVPAEIAVHVNPELLTSDNSGKVQITQGSFVQTFIPVMTDGKFTVALKLPRNAPFTLDYVLNFKNSVATDSTAITPPEKQPKLTGIPLQSVSLLKAECQSIRVIQKSTNDYLARSSEKNPGWTVTQPDTREKDLNPNDFIWYPATLSQKLPEMQWTKLPNNPNVRSSAPVQSIHIVNKAFSTKVWYAIYSLSPNTTELRIPKFTSQILVNAERDRSPIAFSETADEYIINIDRSGIVSDLVTIWQTQETSIARFSCPYPKVSNALRSPIPVLTTIISAPDSLIFFPSWLGSDRYINADSVPYGQSNLFVNNLQSYKSTSIRSIRPLSDIHYMTVSIRLLSIVSSLMSIAVFLAGHYFFSQKRVTSTLFSISVLLVLFWSSELFSPWIVFPFIGSGFCTTGLMILARKIKPKDAPNSESQLPLSPSPVSVEKEPSTVLRHASLSESKLNVQGGDNTLLNENPLQTDWNLNLEPSE